MYEEANGEFRTAVAQTPGNAMYRVRWGRLLHERFNNSDADDLFNEALKSIRTTRRPMSAWLW